MTDYKIQTSGLCWMQSAVLWFMSGKKKSHLHIKIPTSICFHRIGKAFVLLSSLYNEMYACLKRNYRKYKQFMVIKAQYLTFSRYMSSLKGQFSSELQQKETSWL